MGRSEKIAVEEIARTVVHPVQAWCAIVFFLLLIAVVGVADLRLFSNIPAASSDAPVAETSKFLESSELVKSVFVWNRGARDWIKRTEDHVSTESPFSQLVQPWVQTSLMMTGEGGGDVMVGQEGWLYYRPSYRFLTKVGEKEHASSAQAILAFSEDLRERGIQLVIVPAWPKLSIHPEKFGAGKVPSSQPIFPAAYAGWRKQLEEAGVLVYDSSAALSDAKASHADGAYLKTDSHWNPVGMKRAAEGLAAFLVERQLASKGNVIARETKTTIRNSGDLLRMLRLPDGLNERSLESTEISIISHADGTRWMPEPTSSILVLGDSYCNIFSLVGMEWGQDAGFTEHLGAALGQPVDAILRNGDGAHATRAMLARELNTGRDRLAGKKVVIWEFAASQITEGIWPLIPCRTSEAPPQVFEGEFLEVADGESLEITGKIAMMGAVPNPNSTAYKNYLGYFVLDSLQRSDGSPAPASRTIIYGLVMQDKKLTELAALRPGQRIRAKLRSWSSAEGQYGREQRSLPEGDLELEPINWLESFSPF
jgi:alginate O-acetyltransferase complex protein AlgJ